LTCPFTGLPRRGPEKQLPHHEDLKRYIPSRVYYPPAYPYPAPARGYHQPVYRAYPSCAQVWTPGYYDPYGNWIFGYYRYACTPYGY